MIHPQAQHTRRDRLQGKPPAKDRMSQCKVDALHATAWLCEVSRLNEPATAFGNVGEMLDSINGFTGQRGRPQVCPGQRHDYRDGSHDAKQGGGRFPRRRQCHKAFRLRLFVMITRVQRDVSRTFGLHELASA